MSDLKVKSGFASAPDIRERARRVVETDSGAFLIRKLEGMDFVQGGVKLPSGKKIDKNKTKIKEIEAEITQDIIENASAYYRVVIEKGVVSEDVVVHPDGRISYDLTHVPMGAQIVRTPKLIIDGEADTTKNEIMITDLSESDRVKIISAIELFIGLDAALEKRLENFRTKDNAATAPDGESVRETPDRTAAS